MTTQTRSWQRKILTEAQRDNYAGLYWWIEASWGAGKHVSPVGYPGQWIPLVPVAPDPDASRRIAGMLAYLLKLALPECAGHQFEVMLTHVDALRETGAKWYVWTEDIPLDAVCDYCASVEVVGYTFAEFDGDSIPWICEGCAGRMQR